MPIIKRPPNDSFTLKLFLQVSNQLIVPHDPIYIWSAVMEPGYHFKGWDEHGDWFEETEVDYRTSLFESIHQKHVVLAIKDHLTSINNFNPWSEDTPTMVEYLKDLFSFYSDKKFLLLTSMENLQHYITDSNVYIVPWGGDITNQKAGYQNLPPVLDKNFDSDRHYITLNRNARTHRAHLLAYLFNTGLNEHGQISCMFDAKKVASTSKWVIDSQYLPRKKIIPTIYDSYQIYQNNNNDNVRNFNEKLRSMYRDSFVEIITETSFTEQAYLITEKTLNSFYGCNFPILLCGPGAVQLLREIGFDMFDDIVNHSYDSIVDPAERLKVALESNFELLSNGDIAKLKWKQCETRFKHNINIARNELYSFFENRMYQNLSVIKDDYEQLS